MTVESVAALLREAAKTHHRVYRITDGHDPDWASWYADWLITLSELPELLGRRPVRSNFVHALVDLERRFHADPGWELRYAAHLVDWFGGEHGTAAGTGGRTDEDPATHAAQQAVAMPESVSPTGAADEPAWPSFAGAAEPADAQPGGRASTVEGGSAAEDDHPGDPRQADQPGQPPA